MKKIDCEKKIKTKHIRVMLFFFIKNCFLISLSCFFSISRKPKTSSLTMPLNQLNYPAINQFESDLKTPNPT
jgi:hypothetical protein